MSFTGTLRKGRVTCLMSIDSIGEATFWEMLWLFVPTHLQEKMCEQGWKSIN